MLDLLGIASLSFLTALSGAVVPGPVFALVVSESIRSGKIAGPLIILGHFIIEWIIIFMIFLGLGPLLEHEGVKVAVGYIGGVILIFMGLRLAMDSLRIKIVEDSFSRIDQKRGRLPLYNLIASGFLASCSNPYFFLWWLTTGVPVIVNSMSIAGALGFTLFLIGHSAADLLWFSLVGYSIHKGRRILSKKFIQAILLVSASFLIAFAVF
ncbi:MAG: LysE family transporter, partial [Candidatus Bathyarchaeia archaeon]